MEKLNLQAIFVANGAAVALLLILLLSSRRTLRNRLPDNKLFLTMVFSAILQCIVETAAFAVDGHPETGRLLSLALNSLSFVNNITFAFIWTVYADYKLFADTARIRRRCPLVAIPALLVVLGSVVNLFTPVFFSVNADNMYERTGLYFIPCVFTYLYLAYGVLLIYRNRHRGTRYLFLPALVFMAPILLGSMLQFLLYGLSLIWIGVAIALTSIYINVQNEVSYTDSLSGMYTRQYLNRYLDSSARRLGQRAPLSGILLDIDRFKSINDRFGHLTGDDAIRYAAAILRTCVPQPGFVSRFAGDEFVIILATDSPQEVETVMQRIRQQTEKANETGEKPYALSFSMGSSMFDPQTDTVEDFVNRMDSAMYAEKNQKHPHRREIL